MSYETSVVEILRLGIKKFGYKIIIIVGLNLKDKTPRNFFSIVVKLKIKGYTIHAGFTLTSFLL